MLLESDYCFRLPRVASLSAQIDPLLTLNPSSGEPESSHWTPPLRAPSRPSRSGTTVAAPIDVTAVA